ncbi:SpoIIE family protein phosphatase [Thalassorhabdus alkalitolerans]|uniref:SpoIIE family protein phosphatase n=1 Tax=Thalassorhabdus alkalitolerans TaxID=2282697 RepID=A0ABW0YNL4_9BACI|nr:SpoIIE family protein phosphatase [Bacillus sp. FJAT-44742]
MIENKQLTKVDLATFQKGKSGNLRCGDAFVTIETDEYFLCAVADGLGSGEGAYRSAMIAMDIVEKHHTDPVPSLLEQCNQALMHERGVVITILKVMYQTNEIVYGNIGNIGCMLFTHDGQALRPIPAPGYLSGRKFQYRMEHFPYRKGFSFILHSDGATFTTEQQRWLRQMKNPEEVVSRMAETAKNSNDDVTIVVGQVR